MDEFKELMHFSRGERMAIIFLSAAIAIAVLLLFIPAVRPKPDGAQLTNIDSLNRLQMQAIEKNKAKKVSYEIVKADVTVVPANLKPFRFNPNGLSVEKWKEMGLSDRQIRSIKNYEMKGGRFVRKEDFKKMYLISDEEYKILEPYIDIPIEKYKRVESESKKKPKAVKPEPVKNLMINLNTADSAELVELPGIAPWTAHRIVKYRDRLGGFVVKSQLTEVRGVDSLGYARIENMVFIGESEKPVTININDDSFSVLLRHPYLDYKTVKAIVNYREKRGVINDYNQLVEILDESPNPLIAEYINYK